MSKKVFLFISKKITPQEQIPRYLSPYIAELIYGCIYLSAKARYLYKVWGDIISSNKFYLYTHM